MEKLREVIVKMSNKESNVPLTETQNSILQQSLTSYLSNLRTTPALQGLDKEGGSIEDSISEFIKKENHSLPRAHMTLLKHHLQKMMEKGEILMIDGGRFLLPSDSENLKEKKEDAQAEGRVKEPKDKRHGRAFKGKDDRDDPDTILLKDLRLPKKLTKK